MTLKAKPEKKRSTSKLPPGVHLNLSQLARVTGWARETVRRRLEEEYISPTGEEGGSPVYAMAEVWQKLHPINLPTSDPSLLRGKERIEHIKAIREQNALDLEEKLLLRSADVRDVFTAAFLGVQREVSGIPDQLELRLGLKPEQVIVAQDICDNALLNAHQSVEKVCGVR